VKSWAKHGMEVHRAWRSACTAKWLATTIRACHQEVHAAKLFGVWWWLLARFERPALLSIQDAAWFVRFPSTATPVGEGIPVQTRQSYSRLV
jgi:hypothetical protein